MDKQADNFDVMNLEDDAIAYKRNLLVVKANELIQRSRSQLTAQQYDILSYLISKIKPREEPEHLYSFSIKEFCKLRNKDATEGWYYTTIKNDIQAIASINLWILQENGKERLTHWIDDAFIEKGNGIIEISFHKSIYPYLFSLRENFTAFPLEYTLCLKTVYAKILYELLKSMERLNGARFLDISYLMKQMGVDYKYYYDFKRFVLDKAIKEINELTDLEVIAIPKRLNPNNKRAVSHIAFTIKNIKYDDVWGIRCANRRLVLDNDFAKSVRDEVEYNKQLLIDGLPNGNEDDI